MQSEHKEKKVITVAMKVFLEKTEGKPHQVYEKVRMKPFSKYSKN